MSVVVVSPSGSQITASPIDSINSTVVTASSSGVASLTITQNDESPTNINISGIVQSNINVTTSGNNGTVTVLESGAPTSVITINQGQQGPAGVSLHYVQNYGDNRLLSSDGTPSGIYAETNLSFDGSQLSVGGTPVSLSGHTHIASNISNFSEAVDDRINSLLVAGTGINLNYNDLLNLFTISTTGLSFVGHTHTSSNITDFDSSVSGLLPSISGTGYVKSNFANNIYTISVSGLQPSGNYSLVGHTHTSSDITNFDSAVSGLIPPSNFTSLSGISGIVVTNTGTNYFVALSDPTIQLTDITDLSSNARSFLLTPSSSNFQTLVTNETGSGVIVFNNSPVFSGTPTVPTANSGTNTNQIASTAFVRTEISNLIDSAPSTLDTLNELAQALGDDPNFATTVTTSIGTKVSKSGDTMTGSLYAPSGIFTYYLSVSGIPVSVTGHSHSSSEIVDFNSSVSGLLPSVTGTGYVTSSFANNIYTINVTGLQPTGNYSVVGHTHTVSNITDITSAGSGIVTAASFSAQNKLGWTLLTNTTGVAGGQYYSPKTSISTTGTLTISDPATASDGDFYIVIKHSGNGYNGGTVIGGVNYPVGSNAYVIRMYNTDNIFPSSASWKSYTLDNYHTHVSANITNFNSSVSGLLPSVSGSGYAVSSFSNNIYTISVTGLQPSGSYASGIHTHMSSDIIDLSGYVNSGVNTYLTGLNIIGNNCDTKYIVIQDISNNTKLVSISGIAEAISVIDGGGVLYSGC